MSKIIRTTAKELAFDAYLNGLHCDINTIGPNAQMQVTEQFENWWSNHYGNKDTTNFNPDYNIYVDGKRYIKAE